MARLWENFHGLVRLFRLKTWFRLLLLCTMVGVVAGLGALAFDKGLALLSRLLLEDWAYRTDALSFPWPLAVVPMLGGALAGFLVWRFAPEASGHGTDAVIRAYHKGRGEIRARVPWVKGLSSILTIGSGGSAGKEGPIAQISAGFGSILAHLFRLSVPDRRILMLAGVAGGIGAIFKAPLGGALFAAEVLYRDPDFEHDAVIPGVISSVTAYSVFTAADGHKQILEFIDPNTLLPFSPNFPSEGGHIFPELLHYAVLSILCALTAYLFVKVLRLSEKKIFGPLSLPLPQMLKPALGGLALGMLVISLNFLISQISVPSNMELGGSRPEHLMAGGHGYLQTAVNCALDPTAHPAWTSFLLAGFLAFVVVAKIAATSCTLGSGGSGGLLFPALFLGGITGAAYAKLVRAFSAIGWVPDFFVMTPNARAGMILVGMGGVFAACTKTPIASLVMVSEITGSYGLLVPLMMTCASAYLLSRSFSLSTEQVPGIADSPAHRGEFMLNVLEGVRVAEALPPDARPILIPENTPFPAVLRIVKESPASVFLIVDEQARVAGIFSIGDMRQVIHEQSVGGLLVAGDLIGAPYATIAPDDGLDAALRLFTRYNTEVLAVTDPTDEQKPDGLHPLAAHVVGILQRRDLVATYHRRLHDLLAANGETEDETHVFIAAREAAGPDADGTK